MVHTMFSRRDFGFTLIELLIVMAIMALLLSIATPKYFASLEHAKEATLRQNLHAIRYAIDRYKGDHGEYPQDLRALVVARYLRQVPEDPMTGSSATWKLLPSPNADEKGLYDVRSGATTLGRDGTPASSW